jgi:hypothetical protein
MFAKYRKFWVAAAAVVAVAGKAYADGHVSNVEWGDIAFVLAGAVGVLLTPNKPEAPAVRR